jgi:hypothetical protein
MHMSSRCLLSDAPFKKTRYTAHMPLFVPANECLTQPHPPPLHSIDENNRLSSSNPELAQTLTNIDKSWTYRN